MLKIERWAANEPLPTKYSFPEPPRWSLTFSWHQFVTDVLAKYRPPYMRVEIPFLKRHDHMYMGSFDWWVSEWAMKNPT